MDSVTVYKPGQEVYLHNNTGTVLEVCIGGAFRITYRVVWWDGHERKTEWLDAWEVDDTTDGPARLQIGFLQEAA